MLAYIFNKISSIAVVSSCIKEDTVNAVRGIKVAVAASIEQDKETRKQALKVKVEEYKEKYPEYFKKVTKKTSDAEIDAIMFALDKLEYRNRNNVQVAKKASGKYADINWKGINKQNKR